MKKPNNEDNFVLIRDNYLKNNSAFSLVEFMVASAVSLIVTLGISSIFIFALTQFRYVVALNQAQENVLWLAYHTRSVISQAVDIQQGCSTTGCINAYGTVSFGATAAQVASGQRNPQNIGVFNREWGTDASEMHPTAITVVPPVNSSQGITPMSGIVIFDLNSGNGNPVTPSLDDIWFDNVVQYDVNLGSFDTPGGYLSSVTVTISTRYHRTTDTSNMNWCPQAELGNAGCTQNDSFRDLTEEVTVGLRNNYEHWSAGVEGEGIHGKLYYFRYFPPKIE